MRHRTSEFSADVLWCFTFAQIWQASSHEEVVEGIKVLEISDEALFVLKRMQEGLNCIGGGVDGITDCVNCRLSSVFGQKVKDYKWRK